jgi:hypothetical protein
MAPNDNMLMALISVGCIAAIGLILNYKPLMCAIIGWISYTSITVIGGDFLVIIIDLFLSEVGFLLIILHLAVSWLGFVPKIVDFSFIFLNFRLWFSMGFVKFSFRVAHHG